MSNDSSIAQHVVNGLRPFFYLHLPSDSSYETLQDVPNYVQRVSSPCISLALQLNPLPLCARLSHLSAGAPLLHHVAGAGGGGARASRQARSSDQRLSQLPDRRDADALHGFLHGQLRRGGLQLALPVLPPGGFRLGLTVDMVDSLLWGGPGLLLVPQDGPRYVAMHTICRLFL